VTFEGARRDGFCIIGLDVKDPIGGLTFAFRA